jgi:SET domain-containing protein
LKTPTINDNAIESPESDYLYIRQSQIPNSGKGLFTAINIYKEETISIFKGDIVTTAEAAKRIEKGQDQYFINLLDGSIMDSMHVDCFAKYANDAKGISNSVFKNNAKITLDEDDNVVIQATKTIKATEEIFCGYGKRYWKKHG